MRNSVTFSYHVAGPREEIETQLQSVYPVISLFVHSYKASRIETTMDDYPDPDEEFELMYAQEMENMNMIDADREMPAKDPIVGSSGPSKSRRTLDFSQPSCNPPAPVNGTNGTAPPVPVSSTGKEKKGESSDPIGINTSPLSSEANKRKFDDIFGDISDLNFDEGDLDFNSKKLKPESDEDLIKRILVERKHNEARLQTMLRKPGHAHSSEPNDRDNISSRVPRWPFIAVTSGSGDRQYVRLRSEEYYESEVANVSTKGGIAMGLLSIPYAMVRQQAQLIVQKRLDIEEQVGDVAVVETNQGKIEDNSQLWVEKYKPKSYVELLSDENTNRTLLHWLKLWDKVVFNREKKTRKKPKNPKPEEKPFAGPNNRFTKKFGSELNDELDTHGCPQFKMALLCGPPGLGKTTLAHMIARHAGYNVVEVNASDERSPEAFRTALQAATQMRAVLGEKRPNCLVLDEIDGAPAASIETLVRFATGKDVGKGRGKKKAGAGILKRPIICICNDVYVPALRPLRQLSFVVHFPPTVCTRLAERLLSIAREQHIKTDLGTLLALAEKSQNDIRSCVSLLSFYKAKDKNKAELRFSDVQRSSIGQKDVQKGLFTVWQEIFQIQRSKHRRLAAAAGEMDDPDARLGDMALPTRMNKVLRTVQGCGDYDRLAQGVFENYPHMNIKDNNFQGIVNSLEWFCFSDVLNRSIYGEQNFVLMSYLPYAFVAYHFNFSSLAWPKLSYPSSTYENSVKENRSRQQLKDLLRGMSPGVRAHTNASQLVLDTLPVLLDILVPSLRPVSTLLYSAHEKNELNHVISIMIDYNLNYIQERTQEGSYVYNLDPNVEELCMRGGKPGGRSLTYSGKQLLSQEIELEKMRRQEAKWRPPPTAAMPPPAAAAGVSQPPQQAVPSHLQVLVPKQISRPSNSTMMKDFFGRMVPCSQVTGGTKPKTDEIVKSDVWFHFKEGFSNAVRRSVRIQDLF